MIQSTMDFAIMKIFIIFNYNLQGVIVITPI